MFTKMHVFSLYQKHWLSIISNHPLWLDDVIYNDKRDFAKSGGNLGVLISVYAR